MRVFVPILILLSVFLFSCSEVENSEISPKSTEPEIVSSFPRPNDEIILEITSSHQSNVDWIRGEVLNFRLYSDGFAEFDDCTPYSATENKNTVEDLCKRNQVKIKQTELAEIREIISNKDFENLKTKYQKIESSCDAIPIVTVKCKNKLIKIIWCDNLAEPKTSPEFPKILSNTFKQTREIKNKVLGKESFSP